MLREKVFKSERARKQALLAGDLAAAHAAQVQKVNALRATGMLVPPGTIPTYLAAADLGARTIRQIAATNAMALEDRVTCENFEELPVEKLFSIPLALKLLYRPLYMRKLAIANFHAPLDDILRELELSPQDVLDFTNLDTPFDAFIAGHRLDQ